MITIVGEYAVKSLIEHAQERVQSVFFCKGAAPERQRSVESLARSCGVALEWVDKSSFEKITRAPNHQGIAAKCRAKEPGTLLDLKARLSQADNALVLMLDEVQDPHNLGACLRSAEVFGVTAVVWPKHRAVKLNETVYKLAAGAVERLTLIEVSNLAQSIDAVKESGLWVAGLAGEADQMMSGFDLKGPTALVMGNEHKGLRSLVRKKCDVLLSIPQLGVTESLNVSVACGISLYEAVRQRGA